MDLKDIKSRINLSNAISQYIKLTKKNQLYWGKCIFHKENTPSFAINNDKEFYHCFGCGAHGDIFTFMMEVEKKPFNEMLEALCEKYHIPYKKSHTAPFKNNHQAILNKALHIYEKLLEQETDAKNFLLNRGITEEIIKEFHLGYSKQNMVVIELLKEYKLEEIKEAGIISMASVDRLRNRIIFPIFNEKNLPIAFAGRVLNNDKPKYINSGETLFFHKNLCLYNINNIPIQVEEIFLVEGYMDAISMSKYGFKHVVASMGTSVSKSQLFILLKRSRKLCILFDGDEGGSKALERVINLLLEMLIPNYSICIGILPVNEDPDSFLQKNPAHTLRNYCKDIIEVLMEHITRNLQLNLAEDLSIAFNRLNNYVDIIKNKSVKSSYKVILEKHLRQAIHSIKVTYTFKSHPSLTKRYIPSMEENIISIILTYPHMIEEVVEQLAVISFMDVNLEKIKNNLILHINTPGLKDILEDVKSIDKIKTLLNHNHSLLMKEDFCRKYLWDLVCLMPNGSHQLSPMI